MLQTFPSQTRHPRKEILVLVVLYVQIKFKEHFVSLHLCVLWISSMQLHFEMEAYLRYESENPNSIKRLIKLLHSQHVHK